MLKMEIWVRWLKCEFNHQNRWSCSNPRSLLPAEAPCSRWAPPSTATFRIRHSFYDRLPTSHSVPHRRGERQGGAAVDCHGAPPILRAHTHGPPCRINHAAEGERPPCGCSTNLVNSVRLAEWIVLCERRQAKTSRDKPKLDKPNSP